MAQVRIDDELLNEACVRMTNAKGRAITRVEVVEILVREFVSSPVVAARGETAGSVDGTKRGE